MVIFKRIIISLLLLTVSIPYFVLSYPNGAGTCDVTMMQSQGHGSPATSGIGGYSLAVKNGTTSGSYIISISGPSSIEGLLVYTQDSKGTRTGNFVIPSNLQQKSCGGTGKNSITHTDQSSKSMPLKLTWTPLANGTTTVRALVVVDSFSNWHMLNDLTFEPSVDSSAPSTPPTSDSSDGNSNNSSGGDGGNSFFQQYSLFIVVIIITAVLYVIGSLVETALRRQQVKARAFAKVVGGFDR